MSFLAANPADFPHLSPRPVEQANTSLPTCNGGCGLPPSYGGHTCSNRAAIPADLFRQDADENFALERVCRYVSRLCSGTASGLFHAPCGSSLFCFGCAALRVKVSLQILFGKNAEKISPEPP
jgi:hypothetical protein